MIGAVHPRYRPPVGHLLTVPAAEVVAWGSPAERTQRLRALQALRQRRARAHFPSFMEYVACNEVTGAPLRMQWFHDEWSQAWDEGKRVLIIAPRAQGKTTIMVFRVIWELGRNPDLRIKIACAADGRAMERLFEISQHITANPRVREVFPDLEPDPNASWSKHAIYVKRPARHRDPSISAHGITATATGTRADALLADDIVDRRNALAMPGMRETIKQAWKSDWVNLVENDGRIWYIGTRWTNNDLTADLMANAEYRQLFYAIGPDFGSMWPDRWPEAALRARHREIGSIEFNRGFRNEVTDADTAVFREGWLHFADLATDPAFQAAARAGELHTITSYDTATAVGDDADYSAGVALAVHPPSRRCYVLDAWHARQTVAQQAAQIYREHQHYRPYRVLIEKAGQAVVDEWLLSEHPELRPVVETVRPTIGKVQRAQAITPLFERGEVIFAAHLNPDAPGWHPGRESIIHEMRDFPVGKNDDQCLVAGTMIATTRGDIPIERIIPGMSVITPFGPRRVLASKKTGNAGVIHRIGLTGTPNHPVFVHGKGFLRMDSLTQYSDCAKLSIGGLLRWTTRIHSWRRRRSHSTGGCIALWEGRDVITSASLPRTQEGKTPRGFTLPSGNMPMARALARDMRYITLMVIHSITVLATLSIYHAANTLRKLSCLRKCAIIWPGLGRLLRRGTGQRRGVRGTGITHQHVNDEHISTSAFTVGTSSRLKTSTQNIVQIGAHININAQSECTTEKSSALFVEHCLTPYSRSIHLKLRKRAPMSAGGNSRSADVYNLTVDAAGCYFANGVLVSNCDALVHGLAAARRYFLDAWAPGVQSGKLAVTIGSGHAGEGAYLF